MCEKPKKMDIVDKNKNEKDKVWDSSKTLDAATGRQYSNTKTANEEPSVSSFPTLIHFPSTTSSSSSSNKSSDSNNTKTKTVDSTAGAPHLVAKTADKIPLASSFPTSIHFSSNIEKDNGKPPDNEKISTPIQKDSEEIKLEESLPIESEATKKSASKLWSIYPINKKSPELNTKDDIEKKVFKPNVVSKTMNDIAKYSASGNSSPIIKKDNGKPLSNEKLSTPIQKDSEKIKLRDSLSVDNDVTKKATKKWWSIFSTSKKSSELSKENVEKKFFNPNVISKTMNDIAKSSAPSNVSSTAAKDNDQALAKEKTSVPTQKDSEKIKFTGDIAEEFFANTKTADKKLSPSPFLDSSLNIEKDNGKPLGNEEISIPIQKDNEEIKPADAAKEISYATTKTADEKTPPSPFLDSSSNDVKDSEKLLDGEKLSMPIEKDSEKIKLKEFASVEPEATKKVAHKWWSIFPSSGESPESPKNDKEKEIADPPVISKTANDFEENSSPVVSINENKIVQSNTDQEASDEKPKSRTKEPCIKVDQLRVIYNKGKSNEVRSLDGIDVEIYPEEYIIIYGPSGCGKSTLLYGISGLQAPTYGDVVVYGKNLAQMTKREKVEFHQSQIGMVFQAFYLIETLTVLDNVCLPKVFRGEPLKERREKAMELLRRFGIAEQADKFPAMLSGGQKQRVSVARALVNNPAILLADEPVGNLDSESAQNVMDIFKEINGVDKKTLILVTHNPDHLVYADRIIHMKDGKKVREEINTDKRPKEAIEKEINLTPEEISSELRLLMRTFKNLSLQQIGVLLIPFKAKQIINHILAALKEEQISAAESFLKELLFKNINNEDFEQKLDLDLAKGGAGWNKLRAISFAHRVQEILEQAEILKVGEETAIIKFTDYLIKLYNLKVDDETIIKFRNFVKLRVENKIDRFGLQQRLDAPKALGGIGLYKGSAEKVVDEVELIMLLKYSEQ